jgi:hypothetical protein
MGISVPQTSTVTILLLTAILILTFKNVYAVYIEPGYVNAFTYTNLTIRDAKRVEAVEGAVVDFNITHGGVIYLGLKPLGQNGSVVLRIDNETIRLGVIDVCRIEIKAVNMTSRINVNVTQRNCGDMKLYVNGSKMPSLDVSYIPQYSGVYHILATDGVFYEKTRVVVVPNVTVSGNVFGEVMKIYFIPPPRGAGARLGTLTLSIKEGVAEVDTWRLGGGNYTLRLALGGVVKEYPISVARAVPTLVVLHRSEYIYGEAANITVKVYVGRREYNAEVRVSINQTLSTSVRAPSMLVLPLLDAGTYQITASVIEDRNVTSAMKHSTFRIVPAPVRVEVKINGTFSNPYIVEYGKVLVLSVSASSSVEPLGEVRIYLDGKPTASLLDTLRIGAGLYNLTVAFHPGNKNFLPARTSTTIYVMPSAPDVKVNKTFSITYGEELTVPVYVRLYGRPINATAVVELAGRTHRVNYTVQITNGVGYLRIRDLPAGAYLGTVSIVPTPNLRAAEAVFNVFVSSALVRLVLDVPRSGVYGELIPVRASVHPADVLGNLYIIINNTVIYAGRSSTYSGWWSPPRGGVFQVVARFESLDPNYASTDNVTFIYIDKARCSISFVLKGDVAPNNTVYVLRRYEIQKFSSLPAYIFINGSRAGPTVVFNKTGVYNITVFFPGDDSYYPCGASQFYTAVENPASVAISAGRRVALIDGALPLTIALESPVGREEGEVVLYKINKTLNETETERLVIHKTATLMVAFRKTGVYEIYAEFLGNEFLLPNRSNVVTVTVEGSYFGIPTFLLAVYLIPMSLGFIAAYVMRRLKKSI